MAEQLEGNKNINVWDQLAVQYNDKFKQLRIYDSSYDAFLQQLSGNKILEIGCGPGIISAYLLEKNKNLLIDAIDNSEGMIAFARKTVEGINFFVKDARNIDDLRHDYNGIIAGFCLPYLRTEELDHFFENLRLISQSNAVIYISTHYSDENLYTIQKSSDGKVEMAVSFHDKKYLEDLFLAYDFNKWQYLSIDYIQQNKVEKHSIYLLKKK